MAALCDIFVHDAFGTAHRAEASTYGIAQFAKVASAGPLLAAEMDAIAKALAQPRRPLVAIVAGSKVSTKLTILQALAGKVDQLIVGGGIANTFMLAAGLGIGKSLAEPGLLDDARAVIAAMKARGADVPIPTDVVTAKTFAADAVATVKAAAEVADDDLILDIGPDTTARLAAMLARPHQADPTGVADVAREGGVELAVMELARIEHRLPLTRPVGGKPGRHLLAKGVAGRIQVVARQVPVFIKIVRRQLFTGTPHATHRQRIQMHAAEMPRCLVFLGIADGAESVVGFKRHLAQGRAAKGDRGRGNIAPVRRTAVVLRRRVVQREAHAFEADEAIGQFVLHRLKAADRLAELLPLLRVVHRHLECAPRRAVRAR